MKITNKTLSNSINTKPVQKAHIVEQPTNQNSSNEQLTRGQRLADILASHVGSWKFLICQSAVLAGWVGVNMTPGVPHWDESPFILLNLVFSFASAYTAPIVLMSQNRQSDIDRHNAAIDHQVNVKAGQNIELLHEKLDKLHTQQLNELNQIVKEQQRVINELKLVLVPTSKDSKELKVGLLPGLYVQTNAKFSKEATTNKPFTVEQSVEDTDKFIDRLTH